MPIINFALHTKWTLALVGSIIRSVNVKIHYKLVDPENHSNTAGIVLTGMFISFFILSCDILAVHYANSNNHEYGENNISSYLNIIITRVILGVDLIMCIIPLTVLLYICCTHLIEDEGCGCCKEDDCWEGCGPFFMKCLFPFIFQAYMHTVFGNQKLDEYFWEELCVNTTDSTTETSASNNAATKDMKRNDRTLWIVSSAVITPLFMLPSHIIFILAAWLTDPPQATSIALVSIGIFLYFFILFRQCYTINKEFDPTECCLWSLFLPLYPIWAILIYALKIAISLIFRCCSCCCMNIKEWRKNYKDEGLFCCFKICKSEKQQENSETIPLLPLHRRNEHISLKMENKNKFFNTKAFCIAYAWGWVLAGFLALFFTALMELPISVFYLPSYLLNIFQVLIVVISLLITYKIISGGKNGNSHRATKIPE